MIMTGGLTLGLRVKGADLPPPPLTKSVPL